MSSVAVLRIALAILIVVDLSLPRYIKRRYPTACRRPGRDLAQLLLPERILTIALYSGLLAFIVNPRWMAWSHFGLPEGLRTLGIAFAIAGLGGLAWAFRHLGQNLTADQGTGDDPTLITTGPYRWVRHPMYSAWAVLLLGYCVLTANWCIALLFLAALTAVVRRTPAEEAALVARFGDAYLDYAGRTGRFIPRRFFVHRRRGR